jgi:hypothetical protein
MAARYSLTIQIAPGLPGHAAVVLNGPSGQTYAGFGPEHHHRSYDEGKFDAHTVRPGEAPPPDFSSVVGDGSYRTFTIPISEGQAKAAHQEIGMIQTERPWYNVWNSRVCTTIVNRIAKAAGLGDDLLYTLPSRSMQYATDVKSTLAANPKANFMIDGAGRPVRIPDALRDVQQDYASVGAGYDTPSERIGHVPGGPANFPSPNGSPSFGAPSPEYTTTPNSDRPASGAADPAMRYLRRVDPRPSTSVFDTGAPAVPFVPPTRSPIAPAPPASSNDRFGNWGYAPSGIAPRALLLLSAFAWAFVYSTSISFWLCEVR